MDCMCMTLKGAQLLDAVHIYILSSFLSQVLWVRYPASMDTLILLTESDKVTRIEHEIHVT